MLTISMKLLCLLTIVTLASGSLPEVDEVLTSADVQLLQATLSVETKPAVTTEDKVKAANQYVEKFRGLCRDGSSHNDCECAEQTEGTTYDECKKKCDDLDACTGFAHHGGNHCKIYTSPISESWSSTDYLLYTCYEKAWTMIGHAVCRKGKISDAMGGTLAECKQTCEANAMCIGLGWEDTYKRCITSSNLEFNEPAETWDCWQKAEWAQPWTMIGHAVCRKGKISDTMGGTLAECKQTCEANDMCIGFGWEDTYKRCITSSNLEFNEPEETWDCWQKAA